jgi:hypothetical protein
MSSRPERILLFRSGRHLGTAIEALRIDSPNCDITIVATPAAVPVLEQQGIDASHRILYDRTKFFQPWPFITSAAGVRAITGRFDRVCVLWNDPDGAGQVNVDHTALAVSPFGFTSNTADGSLIEHRSGAIVSREAKRAASSIGVAAALGLLLFLPARLWRPFRG